MGTARPTRPGVAPYADMLEDRGPASLDAHVRKILAGLPGRILAYHTYRSEHSPTGFPDWVFVGPGGMIMRELKRREGLSRTSPAQQRWLDALRAVGVDADIWRPADLMSGRIARELAALLRPR